jgi:hypothetical protein
MRELGEVVPHSESVGVVERENCVETLRTAEISTAGETACTRHSPRSTRPPNKAGLQADLSAWCLTEQPSNSPGNVLTFASMDEPGEQQSPRSRPRRLPVVSMALGSIAIVATAGVVAQDASAATDPALIIDWLAFVAATTGIVAVVSTVLAWSRSTARATADEAQSRERLRKAEEDFSDVLRSSGAAGITVRGDLTIITPDGSVHDEVAEDSQRVIAEQREDRLALAALWTVTHERLDLYHQIVTGQARRSFVTAQAAIVLGFLMLIGFAVLAVRARTPSAAISVGGLGAVSAAFAAYIGRTFVRSQESAASHLRAYFDQPLEFSRYLAAERLLAADRELTAEQRAAVLSTLVQTIASASNRITHSPGKAEHTK